MNKSLLKLQIGPVQDFIAQARSTRDLWSGSYLLSWLMAHAIHRLTAPSNAVQIVFPSEASAAAPQLSIQPLICHLRNGAPPPGVSPEDWMNKILTPNLPNL